MTRTRIWVCACLLLIACAQSTFAQQPTPGVSPVVPTLVNFSAVLTDEGGKPLIGLVGA